MTKFVRFALWRELQEYLAQGWTYSGPAPGCHGYHSAIVWRLVAFEAGT